MEVFLELQFSPHDPDDPHNDAKHLALIKGAVAVTMSANFFLACCHFGLLYWVFGPSCRWLCCGKAAAEKHEFDINAQRMRLTSLTNQEKERIHRENSRPNRTLPLFSVSMLFAFHFMIYAVEIWLVY